MNAPMSFADRLHLLIQLAVANKTLADDSAKVLANRLGEHLGEALAPRTVQSWLDGRQTPSEVHRQALAEVLGWGEPDSVDIMISDDVEKYGPIALQARTVWSLAANETGLVALRASSKPLSPEAMDSLGDLAS